MQTETEAERKLRHREYSRAYRKAHPEECRAYSKTYQKAHLEARRARARARHKAHPEAHHAWGRAWRKAHPEVVAAHDRAYREAHPGAVRIKEQRRQARKRGLPNTLTAAEWAAIQAAFKHKCAYCGRKIKLTIDHVLSLKMGGGTVAFNTLPACQSCNSIKHTGPPPKPVNLAMGI